MDVMRFAPSGADSCMRRLSEGGRQEPGEPQCEGGRRRGCNSAEPTACSGAGWLALRQMATRKCPGSPDAQCMQQFCICTAALAESFTMECRSLSLPFVQQGLLFECHIGVGATLEVSGVRTPIVHCLFCDRPRRAGALLMNVLTTINIRSMDKRASCCSAMRKFFSLRHTYQSLCMSSNDFSRKSTAGHGSPDTAFSSFCVPCVVGGEIKKGWPSTQRVPGRLWEPKKRLRRVAPWRDCTESRQKPCQDCARIPVQSP